MFIKNLKVNFDLKQKKIDYLLYGDSEFYTDNDASVKLWKGFRLLSVDGSRMTLPNTQELKNKFGQIKTLFYSDTKTETIFTELKDLFSKHLIPHPTR